MTVREQTQQREEQSLSSKAVLSRRTKGRERPEEEDPIRTPFQRDGTVSSTASPSGG